MNDVIYSWAIPLDKICVFSHKTFIPPTSGHNITLFNTLSGLVKEGIIVDFYTYGQKNMDFQYNGINVHVYPFPPLARFLFQNRFFKRIMDRMQSSEAHLCLSSLAPHLVSFASKEMRRSDLIFLEHIWSSLFPLLYAKIFRRPVVIVDHNAEVVLSRRFLKMRTSKLTKFLLFLRLVYTFLLEKFVCSLADRVFVTSYNDKLAINKYLGIPVCKIDVFPPCVNTSRIKGDKSQGRLLRAKLNISRQDLVVCFLGDMTTVPNYMSAKYITERLFPEVSTKIPGMRFLMVGRYRKSSRFPTNPKIIFTGEVKDLTPFLSAADICIAPLTLGSGIKLKILTYFSFGKPVISTPTGMEGIGARDGKEAIISSLEGFTREIVRLASDPELRSRLGREGRKFVEENYDQDVITKRLIRTLRRITH